MTEQVEPWHGKTTPATYARAASDNLCAYFGRGFCAAAVDDFCIGGYLIPGDDRPHCHG